MKQFIICPNCGAIELAEIDLNLPFTFINHCNNCNETPFNNWTPAKAISIKQPWTYLCATGIKTIENRTWYTKYRGPLLLHAGSNPVKMINPSDVFTREQWESFSLNMKTLLMCTGTSFKPLSTSAIIGSVEIVDCVINHESIWAEKCESPICELNPNPPKDWIVYNWVLANPVLFENPVLNVKGKLSFFTPEIT